MLLVFCRRLFNFLLGGCCWGFENLGMFEDQKKLNIPTMNRATSSDIEHPFGHLACILEKHKNTKWQQGYELKNRNSDLGPVSRNSRQFSFVPEIKHSNKNPWYKSKDPTKKQIWFCKKNHSVFLTMFLSQYLHNYWNVDLELNDIRLVYWHMSWLVCESGKNEVQERCSNSSSWLLGRRLERDSSPKIKYLKFISLSYFPNFMSTFKCFDSQFHPMFKRQILSHSTLNTF